MICSIHSAQFKKQNEPWYVEAVQKYGIYFDKSHGKYVYHENLR